MIPSITRTTCWAYAALGVLLAHCVTGCSLIPGDRETLQILDLHASPSRTSSKASPVPWQLAVEVFAAREPVSGVRIAVLESDGAYSVVSGARWSMSAPQLLQAVMVEAFEGSQRISGVGPAASLRGDCRLGGELRTFHWLPEAGVVSIVAAARMQCGPANAVVAMRTFEARAPVTGRGAPALAAAFDAALRSLTPPLVGWVLANGQAD
jgi:cholesterol transport system auxiliary component